MRTQAEELVIERNYGEHMHTMARHWMERAQRAEHMAAVLVLAAGGEVRVSVGTLANSATVTLVRVEDPRTGELVFKVSK